jgi:hypothetical protein
VPVTRSLVMLTPMSLDGAEGWDGGGAAVVGVICIGRQGFLAGLGLELAIHHMQHRGGHGLQHHGDSRLPKNKRLSSSRSSRNPLRSRWKRSTNGSRSLLLKKRSRREGSPPPLPSLVIVHIKRRTEEGE